MFALIALSTAFADETTGPETCVLSSYDSAHCELCTGASYKVPDACSATLSATRELACRTQGGSFWDEIWCDPGHTDPVTEKPDTTDDTKDCAAVGGATGGLAVLVGVVAVLMGRRRG